MLSITINPHDAVGVLDAFGEKQLAFGTALALNRTAEEVQDAERNRVFARFAVRTSQSATFLSNLIKITRDDRAQKDRLMSRVRIEGPGGDASKAELLTRHIEGGTHTLPGGLTGSFFLPGGALRPSRLAIIPRGVFPQKLGLAPTRGTATGNRTKGANGQAEIKGRQRTFVLMQKGTGQPIGIFQRDGKGDIRLLWRYQTRITDRPLFDFYGVAKERFLERWPENFIGMMQYAIATAK